MMALADYFGLQRSRWYRQEPVPVSGTRTGSGAVASPIYGLVEFAGRICGSRSYCRPENGERR